MENELKIKMYSFNLDCKAPNELAGFYAALLKWESRVIDEDFACVYAPGTHQDRIPAYCFTGIRVQTACVAGRI